ncbi:NUDIX hydrolase [Rhizohabitans arisaemae]|uniref:NUDIX hydrolase n=1 Tax=Rhizohabitans arisaemae TaxID=2720610 RepID=UPI0024B219FE|nr:NUDIX hydrolase [Rhizohabitans arisaemae]
MGLRSDALAVLTGWTAPDPAQERLRLEFLRHLTENEDGMWRSCVPGHVTASVAVLSHDGARVLLTLHKIAQLWLQLGGHCEEDDRTLAEAALREAGEESGMPGLRLLPGGPVRLDRHRVRCHPPECWHLDVQYAAVAPEGGLPVMSDESNDLRWFPVTDLPHPTDDAVRGLVADASLTLNRSAGR